MDVCGQYPLDHIATRGGSCPRYGALLHQVRQRRRYSPDRGAAGRWRRDVLVQLDSFVAASDDLHETSRRFAPELG